MIKLAGAAVLVLAFAVSAQAQSGHVAGSAHFVTPPVSYAAASAGGGGAIGSGGTHTLAHFPSAQFEVRNVTGSSSDYIPSTFVTYKAALAEGKAELRERPEPLGASVRADAMPPRSDVKILVVQSQSGGPVIQTH